MSNPTELVRVKDPNTGVEYNATRAHAKRAGLTVLAKPVRDRHGRLINAKSDPLRRPSEQPADPPTIPPAARGRNKPKES